MVFRCAARTGCRSGTRDQTHAAAVGRDGGRGRSGSISSHNALGNSAAAISRRYGVPVRRVLPSRFCYALLESDSQPVEIVRGEFDAGGGDSSLRQGAREACAQVAERSEVSIRGDRR